MPLSIMEDENACGALINDDVEHCRPISHGTQSASRQPSAAEPTAKGTANALFGVNDAKEAVIDVANQLKEKLGVHGSRNGFYVACKNGLSRNEDDDPSPTVAEDSEAKSGLAVSSSVASANASLDLVPTAPFAEAVGVRTLPSGPTTSDDDDDDVPVRYVGYESELQMPDIMRLIQKDLSEPYSIYTYRYFIHNWPKLCFLAMVEDKCIGAVVCKLDLHKKVVRRGYIAMLAVDENYRKRKIGSNLVLKAIRAMVADDADEVVLETEITNKPALRLYENLGFARDKRLFRYYLNGVDALRLKLWLR